MAVIESERVNARARAYPVSSATNGQGLPPGGRRRLKKIFQTKKIKLATLNVGSWRSRTYHGKEETASAMRTRDQNGERESKAREIGGWYKLYYHGEDGTKNGVGIVLCEELKDRVLAVERSSDRVMRTKLEIEGEVGNIISLEQYLLTVVVVLFYACIVCVLCI